MSDVGYDELMEAYRHHQREALMLVGTPVHALVVAKAERARTMAQQLVERREASLRRSQADAFVTRVIAELRAR